MQKRENKCFEDGAISQLMLLAWHASVFLAGWVTYHLLLRSLSPMKLKGSMNQRWQKQGHTWWQKAQNSKHNLKGEAESKYDPKEMDRRIAENSINTVMTKTCRDYQRLWYWNSFMVTFDELRLQRGMCRWDWWSIDKGSSSLLFVKGAV